MFRSGCFSQDEGSQFKIGKYIVVKDSCTNLHIKFQPLMWSHGGGFGVKSNENNVSIMHKSLPLAILFLWPNLQCNHIYVHYACH